MIITFYNVEKMWSADGWLHFGGKEGEEEAKSHSLNLRAIRRYTLSEGTLVVYFKDEDDYDVPTETHLDERLIDSPDHAVPLD